MLRTILIGTLMVAALPHSPALAEADIDPECKLEITGRIDLSPAVESEVIFAFGDKCEARIMNIVIKTDDGIKIHEEQVHHRDIGTSGLTPTETFTHALESLARGHTQTLPALDQIDIYYDLLIELEDYERLRRAGAPAYVIPQDYYYGYRYIVYDENIGKLVYAINIAAS